MHARMVPAVFVAGLALAASGCQRAAQQPPAPEPMAAQVVDVVAKEFGFEPKEIRVRVGMVKFRVRNEGAVEHEFMIEGITAHGAHASETFRPGVTHEIDVELNPGTYPVSCNVPGHKEAGMVAAIVVQ